jgi:hypothetical protein
MDYIRRKSLRTMVVLLLASLLVHLVPVLPTRVAAALAPPVPDNGIVVGQTKLYDERSLALMLQSVQARLANRDFFDQGSIAAALGKMQGARLDTSSFGLNLTTTPLPGIATTNNTGTTTTFNEAVTQPTSPANQPTPFPGTVTTTNVLTPNTVTQTITQPSVAPTAPTLAPQSSAFAFQPPFGLAPQTLLAQQLELTHNLENYRLLLEGSLTDRIINARGFAADGVTVNWVGPRVRAVAGFQISIDSLKQYENAVAEVEITVTTVNPPDPGGHNPPSVVMLLPQENNYNVATVTKDSKQFGFGVAIQPINLGVAMQNQKETLYLVQDTDTIAFQRESPKTETSPPDPQSVTLGWQFRPVLGQKTVKAGQRQVFAVLALPVGDGFPCKATVKAHTHWRRYNSRNKSVGEVISGSSSTQDLSDLDITSTFVNGEPLQPKPTKVASMDAGQGNVLVTVAGSYFLPGTAIVMGDQIIDNAEKGLFLQGENNFRWLVSGQKLALVDDPFIAGRFGPPVELRDPILANPLAAYRLGRLTISSVMVTPRDAENSELVATVVHTVPAPPPVAPAPGGLAVPPPQENLVLLVGGKTYGFSDAPLRATSTTSVAAGGATARRTYQLEVVVPTRSLQVTRSVVVKRLFFGPRFRAEYLLGGAGIFSASKVTVLSSGSAGVKLGISGTGFTNDANTRVIVDGLTITPVGGGGVASLNWKDATLLVLTIPDPLSKSVKQIAITHGAAAPLILPVTVPAPPPPKPTVTSISPVGLNDQVYVTVAGTNLGSVDKVLFQGQILKSKNVSDDGTSMEVLVTKEMTDSLGRKAIDFVAKDGKEVSGILVVHP